MHAKTTHGKTQRPTAARTAGDGMKLHRRSLRLGGRAHTVISLRPGTRARFSTNRFHETWHVVSDQHGARLLAHLLWGLSYQARPGSLVVLDRPFLVPTPFDADPADPIVLVPGWCTAFDRHRAAALLRELPLRTRPDGTVRWRTFGLEHGEYTPVWEPERGTVERLGGTIVLTPRTPAECRDWALGAARLDPRRFGSDHVYLGPWDGSHPGEIQIFHRFHEMLGIAGTARRQVLDTGCAPADPAELRWAVWGRAEVVSGRAHLRVRVFDGGGYRLGRYAARWLAGADVHSLDDLVKVGAAESYRRMRAAGVRGLSTRMLRAMEIAVDEHVRHSGTPPTRQLPTLRAATPG